MSQRNTLEAKRQRRIRRSITKGRLSQDHQINLIDWVKMRARVSTGSAIKVIMAGSLKLDSHTIGVGKDQRGEYLEPMVPASLRGRISVVEPRALKEARESGAS